MPSHEFRCVHLPYCLIRQSNGSYIVLNRNYKPLGFRTENWVTYEDYPIAVTFTRLTKQKIQQLSWNGDANPEAIFLYNDGTVPTRSAKAMKAYLDKLAVLAHLKFTDERQELRRKSS